MKWKDADLIKSAKKYKTKREWRIENNAAYQAARRHGILEACCVHMEKKTKKK
jgi:hypothetical protein